MRAPDRPSIASLTPYPCRFGLPCTSAIQSRSRGATADQPSRDRWARGQSHRRAAGDWRNTGGRAGRTGCHTAPDIHRGGSDLARRVTRVNPAHRPRAATALRGGIQLRTGRAGAGSERRRARNAISSQRRNPTRELQRSVAACNAQVVCVERGGRPCCCHFSTFSPIVAVHNAISSSPGRHSARALGKRIAPTAG